MKGTQILEIEIRITCGIVKVVKDKRACYDDFIMYKQIFDSSNYQLQNLHWTNFIRVKDIPIPHV